MADGKALKERLLEKAALFGGVEQPFKVFLGRVAVDIDIHVERDRCRYVGLVSLLFALPVKAGMHLDTTDGNSEAL